MTEPAFPFDADTEDVVAERDNRRLIAAVAGVVALALLGVFVVLPMFSGESTDDAVVPVRRRPLASPTASASAVPTKPVPITETFNDTVGRDPFRPLYTEPALGGGVVVVGGGATSGGTTSGGTTSGGTTSGGTTGGGTGTGGQPAPGGSTQVGGNRVSLIDVFVRDGRTYAQTRVGSTVYTPVVGATFATNYQLLSASGECATFLYGDENFQLCEGQEVLK